MTVLDKEDYSRQEEMLTVARADLREALATLQAVTKNAWRALGSDRGQPDLNAVYAAVRTVKDCEEGVDFATLDLSTARGDDA